MFQNNHSDLRNYIILSLLIFGGLITAVAGIYFVDGEQESAKAAFEDFHDVEIFDSRSTIHGGVIPLFLQTEETAAITPQAERGATIGEMLRRAGIFSIIIALLILLFIEFFYKKEINRLNYRSLMIVSMFALPMVVVLSTGSTVLETTKTVESCASCHVMDPFVNDLSDDESTTLAARHYKNKWISEHQCYTCHTSYGAHGTFEGKRDGFRHWLLFVTQTWDEPISYSGSYPNMNCTACHSGTRRFMEIDSHLALSGKLRADEVSCTSCHGPAHPTPAERDGLTNTIPQTLKPAGVEINSEELTKLMEMLHE